MLENSYFFDYETGKKNETYCCALSGSPLLLKHIFRNTMGVMDTLRGKKNEEDLPERTQSTLHVRHGTFSSKTTALYECLITIYFLFFEKEINLNKKLICIYWRSIHYQYLLCFINYIRRSGI